MAVTGYVHSYESFGAVDGPGIRFVVFLQGCLLRCKFCHNPDTWERAVGQEVTPEEVVERILDYRNFISRGGVTLSGGEPLLQADFCQALLQLLHEHGIHTAIDTSGALPLRQVSGAIDMADLILLDIKDVDETDCRALTGHGNHHAFSLLDYCEKIKKPVWIRHVLIPQYTLLKDKLCRLAQRLEGYSCVERVELLPYHKMGEYKWEALGLYNELKNTPVPSDDEVETAKQILRKWIRE